MLLVLILFLCNLERLSIGGKQWGIIHVLETPSTARCLHAEKIQCLSVGQAETLPTPDSPAKPRAARQRFINAR